MHMGDYRGVSKAHLEVARHYSSPYLMGPPMCDELIALIEHMYTEEEAEIIKYLPPLRVRTAEKLAKESGRPMEEVKNILNRLAHEKYVIFSIKKGPKELYCLLPIIPGTFELVLVKPNRESVTPWQKKFAELHEALYNTGYLANYHLNKKPVNAVRYLPVKEAIQGDPMAYPSDYLEEILEPFHDFAVGICQCRLTRNEVNEGCGGTLETCVVMGEIARRTISQGRMRSASRQEVIDIKRAAEKEGMVTWMLNVESERLNISCSCCGCCCGALRTVTQFNAPGFIAPPHFMPQIEAPKCTACNKCIDVCPMGALSLIEDEMGKKPVHYPKRCVGCGLCAVACTTGSILMKAIADYEKPKNFLGYLAKYGPSYLSNARQMQLNRKNSQL